jgi:hypothetical protein
VVSANVSANVSVAARRGAQDLGFLLGVVHQRGDLIGRHRRAARQTLFEVALPFQPRPSARNRTGAQDRVDECGLTQPHSVEVVEAFAGQPARCWVGGRIGSRGEVAQPGQSVLLFGSHRPATVDELLVGGALGVVVVLIGGPGFSPHG